MLWQVMHMRNFFLTGSSFLGFGIMRISEGNHIDR